MFLEEYTVENTYNAYRAEGLAEARAEGIKALVDSLRNYIADFDGIFNVVRASEVYADATEDEVKKYCSSVS